MVLNPRNAMYISKNDGKLDPNMIHNKDTLIVTNSIVADSRKNYTTEQIKRIKALQSMTS